MKIAYVTNAEQNSGVGHRASELKKLLDNGGDFEVDEFYLNGNEGTLNKNGDVIKKIRKWPGILGIKTVGWLRLSRGLKQKIAIGEYDLIHLTNQTLSFLVSGTLPSVVTVHDIIEVQEPQQKLAGIVNKYLYGGIRRADRIIAVSQYTANAIKNHYGVSDEKIRVISNGAGKEFHVIDEFSVTVGYQTLRRELGLNEKSRIVLYVGSDHPRKNVVVAVKAFAKARKREKELIFVKVGNPGIAIEREKLLKKMDKLGVRKFVRFIGNVSNERLNELYNLADVFVFPSRFEGFGLPPLQAMACGTPVVTANVTSLPEVVGDNRNFGEQAALVRQPDDVDGYAEDILKVINDVELAGALRRKGIERANKFNWQKTGIKVVDVYREIVNNPKL